MELRFVLAIYLRYVFYSLEFWGGMGLGREIKDVHEETASPVKLM
jgi:hypothetical protein